MAKILLMLYLNTKMIPSLLTNQFTLKSWALAGPSGYTICYGVKLNIFFNYDLEEYYVLCVWNK